MGFNLERVNTGIKKLMEAQAKKSQQRMDSFFKPVSNPAATAASMKRKAEALKATGPAQGKGKAAAGGASKMIKGKR